MQKPMADPKTTVCPLVSDTTAYKRPDITERLALYWRTYADLPSLALHPQTPGYSHGMLIGDTRDARLEIERLRAQNKRLIARLRKAGLLGDPVDALNGEEQMERDVR